MKSTFIKRAIAAMAAMPMLAVGMVLPFTASADENGGLTDANLVAAYDFEDENDKGKDVSGHNHDLAVPDGVEYGKPGDYTSKVVQLRGDGKYLEFPVGLFDNMNNFTLEFASKSRMTDSDNFFSFSIGNNNQKYFFSRLRPSSVYTSITKGSNGAEQGVNFSANTASAWHTYRISVSPTMIAVFLDGQLKGINKNVTTKVSDLGTNLNATFGKSTWSGDKTYNGGIDNVKLWSATYVDDSMVWNGVNVPGSAESSVTLPAKDALGDAISWKSSDPTVMGDDGTVVKNPAKDTEVTMTATVTAYGKTFTKDFTVTVTASITDAATAADRLLVDYQLSAGKKLPTVIPGASDAKVTWKSSDVKLVGNDGNVSGADGDTAESVDLTATVTLGGSTKTKTFKSVQVMPKDARTLVSYTRDSSADGGIRVAGSLHLALSADGKSYEALNQNYGVAFAEAKWTTTDATASWEIRDLTDPYLFRMADGRYAYVAISTTDNGTRVDPGKILFSTSDDLVQWSGNPNDYVIDQQRTLTDDTTPFDAGSLTAGYDASTGEYRIGWTVNGASKYVTTADFQKFSAVRNGPSFVKTTVSDLSIDKSVPANTMSIDKATADELAEKLGRVQNTEVEQNQTLEIENGTSKDDLLKQVTGVGEDGKAVALKNGNLSKGVTAKATYSDGSTHDFRVNWNADDLAKVDTSKAGTYTISGTINQQNFSDGTMMKWRADPNVVYWKGQYYFIATNEGSDKNIYIRSSATMEGLKDASATVSDGAGGHYVPNQDHFLWGDKDSTGHDGYHWAPELHVIDGKLYCFYAQFPTANNDGTGTAYSGPNWMGPAAYVMELKDGGDPLVAADWTEHRVVKSDGSHLSDKGLTIDMTYFEVNGQSYVAWSQGDEDLKGALANVSIAKVDKSKPWVATSTPKRIAKCDYGWELGGVNEGPNVLVNDGKVYMVFSAQYVGTQYATGMMIADVKSDLSDPSSWTKSNYPWMHNGVFPGQSGLGHNSYFTDPYGDIYNVYHFGGSGNRHASIVPVYFRSDGSPILDMKTSEELDQSKKNVTLTITVKDKTVDPGVINAAPTLSGVDDVTVTVGDSFDPLSGVTASDDEDGDLTGSIRVSGSVNTTKAGEYKLTYTVVDSQGAKASKIRVVTVKAKDSGEIPNPEQPSNSNGSGDKADPSAKPSGTANGSKTPAGTNQSDGVSQPLSKTGVAVASIAGVVALLAAASAALVVLRKRHI